MRLRTVVIGSLLLVTAVSFVAAEDNPNKLSLGLSYLATTGNSSSQSGGVDFLYKHQFDPWGLEVAANYLRAEQNGVLTAKKLFVGVRGTYAINADFGAFAAASYLQDQFAGLDPRVLGSAGVTYKFLKGPEHELAFDVGLTWTRDDLVGDGSTSYMGALAAARYVWNVTKTSKVTEDLAFYPSFKDRDNWRIESATGVQAAVSSAVALKLSYGFRYANRPVPGFHKTDTQTAASLVINFQ